MATIKDEEVMAKQVGGSHYKKHNMQPWDIIDEYGLNFYEASALKYLLRKKGNRTEDLNKLIHYAEKEIVNIKRKEQEQFSDDVFDALSRSFFGTLAQEQFSDDVKPDNSSHYFTGGFKRPVINLVDGLLSMGSEKDDGSFCKFRSGCNDNFLKDSEHQDNIKALHREEKYETGMGRIFIDDAFVGMGSITFTKKDQ